jgi:hypothetical protein
VTLTQAPLQHWAAAFSFLLEDVAQAVVATPHFLEPPKLEGGVVRIGSAVASVCPMSFITPAAPSMVVVCVIFCSEAKV